MRKGRALSRVGMLEWPRSDPTTEWPWYPQWAADALPVDEKKEGMIPTARSRLLPPAWWRAKHAETQRRSDAVGGGRIMKLRYQAFRGTSRRRER